MSEIWVNESPISLVAGAEPQYAIVFYGATTVSTTNAVQRIYKNGTGTNLSSTMLTGSLSASGNVLTLRKITGLVGGNSYVVAITCTVDGVVEVRKLQIDVQKDKQKQ